MFKKSFFLITCVVLVIVGFLNAVYMIHKTGSFPYPSGFLTIDSKYYLAGMISILKNGDFLALKDLYHSPGYQLYLALLASIIGIKANFIITVKIISLILFAITSSMLFLTVRRMTCLNVALLTTAFFSMSVKWHTYISIIQPEVLLGFLGMSIIFLSPSCSIDRSIKSSLHLLLLGLLSATICMIQVRFLLIIPCMMMIIIIKKPLVKNFKNKIIAVLTFLIPVLAIIGGWSVYQSERLKKPVLIQTNSKFRLELAYNLNSTGKAFPYPEIKKPVGFNLIRERPDKFIWLLKERFLYLWDLKKDRWYLGNPFSLYFQTSFKPGNYDRSLYTILFFLFLIGIIFRTLADLNTRTWTNFIPFLILMVHFSGPLLVFSSSRFIIPALPLVSFYQAFALWQILQYMKKLLN